MSSDRTNPTTSDMSSEKENNMTSQIEAPRGFQERLLAALSDIDADRTLTGTPQPRPRLRSHRRALVGAGAGVVVVLGGGVAAAATSGLFDAAPTPVKHAFSGLDAPGTSVESTDAVRIGVIDDHVAYAAPTANGGFCLYFSSDPARSGPVGGSCLNRGSASDEAVFSVLWGADGGYLFGRAGASDATAISATFPRTGDTINGPVADSGFFAVAIPPKDLGSLMAVTTPDPGKNVPTKNGAPIRGIQLDRIGDIAVAATNGDGAVVARGVAVTEPGLPAGPTDGPTR